ncbi:MAG: ABC transporter substrate-binding protein [Pseudomonadota bacterium]
MTKALARALTLSLAPVLAVPAAAEDIALGVVFGYTGPIESLTPDMAAGAELAITEINGAGGVAGGQTIAAIRGDSTCTDAAAERLITAEGVKAIVGADCSGVTTAILQNVAKATGTVMISPSATSPALTTIEDDGLFFRTAPSDARQGEVLAQVLSERGIASAAMTYTNNDYGKGLADSIQAAFEARGGEITIVTAHEDGKADYAAEVGALAQAGGEVLIVAGYLDQGGRGVIQGALDTGAFETFVLPDGMIGDSLIEAIGADLDGSFGVRPGSDSPGAATFADMAKVAGFNPGPYAAESYDAAALILLAMQATGSTESADIKGAIEAVANAPGEQIFPGELAKALTILADGGEIDYQGATAVELIGPGESAGSFAEIEIDGALKTVGFR